MTVSHASRLTWTVIDVEGRTGTRCGENRKKKSPVYKRCPIFHGLGEIVEIVDGTRHYRRDTKRRGGVATTGSGKTGDKRCRAAGETNFCLGRMRHLV
ncbi:hypothetical protein HZH66_013446 [Vespula vulgaris]|uniref:Uncharacterized protein n=1 Tax=Vespula vulgaris TaxID=7454 RepID=A0A834J588_VESVU|nr:hypothetical protein HZH66_013446 [Vespula vulgaris]